MLRLSLLANCSASVLCFVSVLFDCHFLVDSWSSFLCPSSALSLRLPSSTFVAAFSDRRAHSHFTSSSFVHWAIGGVMLCPPRARIVSWRHVVSAECSYRQSLSAKCLLSALSGCQVRMSSALWLASALCCRSLQVVDD